MLLTQSKNSKTENKANPNRCFHRCVQISNPLLKFKFQKVSFFPEKTRKEWIHFKHLFLMTINFTEHHCQTKPLSQRSSFLWAHCNNEQYSVPSNWPSLAVTINTSLQTRTHMAFNSHLEHLKAHARSLLFCALLTFQRTQGLRGFGAASVSCQWVLIWCPVPDPGPLRLNAPKPAGQNYNCSCGGPCQI